MKKILKEWFVPAPWGKIAMISWGSPAGEPVLLVHGREDSAATFLPLLNLLPDKFHYVGFDLPGHGKSDPFPIGVMVMRFHFMAAIEAVLKHLQWTRFVFVGHSLGSELGLFYNALYPHRIAKFVHIDVGPGLQNNQRREPPEYFATFHARYYGDYLKYNHDDRVYSKARALDAVMKFRGLNEEQAELILSRNLWRVGEDRYKLSWDKRLKNTATLNLPSDYLLQLFTSNAPPTLFIQASDTRTTFAKGLEGAKKMIAHLKETIRDFDLLIVEGNHDVHVSHPERFSTDVCRFLNREFGVRSRL